MTMNWLGKLKRKLTVLALALPAIAFSHGGCNDLGYLYDDYYGDPCCGYYDDYYYEEYYYEDDYYYDSWDYVFDFFWW